MNFTAITRPPRNKLLLIGGTKAFLHESHRLCVHQNNNNWIAKLERIIARDAKLPRFLFLFELVKIVRRHDSLKSLSLFIATLGIMWRTDDPRDTSINAKSESQHRPNDNKNDKLISIIILKF